MMRITLEIDVQRLRELREERALSHRELAALAGVGHNTIYRIENGQSEVIPRTVRRLAGALGVEPKEIMRRKTTPPREEA